MEARISVLPDLGETLGESVFSPMGKFLPMTKGPPVGNARPLTSETCFAESVYLLQPFASPRNLHKVNVGIR